MCQRPNTHTHTHNSLRPPFPFPSLQPLIFSPSNRIVRRAAHTHQGIGKGKKKKEAPGSERAQLHAQLADTCHPPKKSSVPVVVVVADAKSRTGRTKCVQCTHTPKLQKTLRQTLYSSLNITVDGLEHVQKEKEKKGEGEKSLASAHSRAQTKAL